VLVFVYKHWPCFFEASPQMHSAGQINTYVCFNGVCIELPAGEFVYSHMRCVHTVLANPCNQMCECTLLHVKKRVHLLCNRPTLQAEDEDDDTYEWLKTNRLAGRSLEFGRCLVSGSQ
jgi:hypothetical protein